jgi:hypothetical protein
MDIDPDMARADDNFALLGQRLPTRAGVRFAVSRHARSRGVDAFPGHARRRACAGAAKTSGTGDIPDQC